MGKLMQEFFEKEKALKLAKEVADAKLDINTNLNVNAVTRLVAEQYKKAHNSTDQSMRNEHEQLSKDIIPPEADIDNGQVLGIDTSEVKGI